MVSHACMAGLQRRSSPPRQAASDLSPAAWRALRRPAPARGLPGQAIYPAHTLHLSPRTRGLPGQQHVLVRDQELADDGAVGRDVGHAVHGRHAARVAGAALGHLGHARAQVLPPARKTLTRSRKPSCCEDGLPTAPAQAVATSATLARRP